MAKYVKFPSMAAGLGIAIIAVLGVAVASGLGLLSPITKVIGRATGTVKAWAMKALGIDRRNGGGGATIAAAILLCLFVGVSMYQADSTGWLATPFLFGQVIPELWRMRKVTTKRYPVVGNLAVHAPANLSVDLKDYLQSELVSELWVRLFGSFTVAGAVAPGTATGRENPEALLINAIARHTPSLSAINKENLSARGIVVMRGFDTGYIIRHADVADTNGAKAIDVFFPLKYKQSGSVNPVEWSLPLGLFESYVLDLTFGGREQLFSGGTPGTWDFSNLAVEIWANVDDGVAGQFHIVEEFEKTLPVNATQPDLEVIFASGRFYTHLLFMAERDNVPVNDVLRNIHIQSAGRIWTPQGDLNGPVIQRWNRDTHINSAAEDLTGLYFIPALRDGMYKRSIDAMSQRLEVKLDVVKTSGVEVVKVRGRRIIPLGLNVPAR